MARANIEVIHEVFSAPNSEGWTLCLQWAKYNYDNGSPSQLGYRFMYRRPSGTLQAAMGQARIPSASAMLRLIQMATEAGWFVICEAGRTDLADVVVDEQEITKVMSVADLFEEEPSQWGLRGDPYLWREMRDQFRHTHLPSTGEEWVALIEGTFTTLTGHSISEADHVFVEKYSHGGMSSGHVSPEFWRKTALPLLRKRFLEAL